MAGSKTSIKGPRWLLAELSYRCPLRCVYCSNPENHADLRDELSTEDWRRVLREGRAMGAVQLGLSGGEPLVRADLEAIASEARRLGYYTNLITSGIGLTAKRLARLKTAGIDHIQLSLQAATPELNNQLGGAATFERKRQAATLIKDAGYPMVLNVVLHRHNLAQIDELLALAVAWRADYVELANAQYDGWAFRNRDGLLPSLEQVRAAERIVERFRASHARPKIFWVVPDYLEDRPKPCGGGWATHMLVVAPDGLALPCHGARQLPLAFPNVRASALADIWFESPAFQRFRGDAWMPEPCRGCPEKGRDFAGCRCQAFRLTGDPAAADPACAKVPGHAAVVAARQHAGQGRLRYRDGAVFGQRNDTDPGPSGMLL